MIPRSLLRSSRVLSTKTSPSAAFQASRQSFFPVQEPHAAVRRSAIASRCYSATAEPSKENNEAKAEPATEAEKEDPVKKELEAKRKEALEMTDKYKRSVADYRNLQEQTKREVRTARDFAIQGFAKDLIESIDNFDRALGTVPKEALTQENKDLLALHDGLRMTETILMNTLKKHGLERFDPAEASDKFDPNKHEATFMVPQPDKEDNTVFHTQQKGFSLNGRILRAAKVGVVKNS